MTVTVTVTVTAAGSPDRAGARRAITTPNYRAGLPSGMEREGSVAPETEAAAREEYARLAGPAATVTREVARALDAAERLREKPEPVVATAHDALFASLLVVHRGTRGEFEAWVDERDLDPDVVGSGNVERVAWHPVPSAGVVAAATFQDEPEAAVATIRRRAFGEYYRPVVRGADGDADAGGEGTGA